MPSNWCAREIGPHAFDGVYSWSIPSGNYITLPSTFSIINEYTFANSKTSGHLIIPSSITRISYSAFESCIGITSVDFSQVSSISTLPSSCFKGCSSLSSIFLSSSINAIEASCFESSGLTTFPKCSSLQKIGARAFYSCKALQSIDFQNILSIGESSFAYCTSLSGTLNIPTTLQNISQSSFIGCSNLSSISYSGTDSRSYPEIHAFDSHLSCYVPTLYVGDTFYNIRVIRPNQPPKNVPTSRYQLKFNIKKVLKY